MKHALMMLLLAMALAAECPASGLDKPEAKKPFVPTDHYVKKSVEGWVVYVNKDLLDGRKELGDRALRLLENKLYDIRRSVPPAALESLVKVPIWLGVDDGHAPCAEYHPNRQWLVENGYNPDKAKGVEIGNAENFVQWSHDQPSMILHELSHAYHDRILGFDHPGVMAAFKKAVESKAYESVLRCNGGMERAYALSNEQEYFAEASEAYFGTNDFYPFVRAELKKHDPVGFETLHEAWEAHK